jgi:hypothetical protein
MPRLKKKWMQPEATPIVAVTSATHDCGIPAHPNVKQAARHFGTSPAAFRRLAIREGFKRVRVGKRDTYDLQEMNEWWQQQARNR